ncbi:regulation of nuclear pre-mRNA domain-containing 2 isoform X1 [Pelobates cultripes]|uniref:Regulation of nuclear pre-mRNA domain-containing protein 2 n=1 Tax=Pelobates cultripes TaxID=61616 RepID=A0AAD1TMS7_PELCU|nr:regulation of nuclear pre-mRNA domain-containing 2 isoform X1 [Pelobates cultripes]
MAAGGSGSGSGKAGALEAALDRKLQSVTNTMESIQSLSSWCIDNKKHHAAIVQHWLKWLRRSGVSHRLNLFYLANDVLQNCKRKNALIYRDTFSDVLLEAASLVRDQSVSKSIERIFKIWEERNVYTEDTIASFRAALSIERSVTEKKKRESKQMYTGHLHSGGYGKRERSERSERPERSKTVRPKPVEKVQEAPAINPKAALKSKIVAEFRPQNLIDDLLGYKQAIEHVEVKEKQLSNMRVDVCSTETLKRLKDRAGGKKFSKDFEEASAKLEEFVNILEKEVKNGSPLTDALENACIFYEAQYREVKVVVNAYKTFANRVNNLKKKLDQLKSTLPDPEESPVPSPTMDAPSPTGSESPFQGMGAESPLSPEVEPIPSVSPEPPKDNRVVEDMELSDVDADEEMPNIIVEERQEPVAPSTPLSKAEENASPDVSVTMTDPTAPVPNPVSAPASLPVISPVPVGTPALVSTPLPVTPAKTVTTPSTASAIPLALPSLANVDLGKISSILSSLTSVMKNTGVSPAGKPSPGTPTTPTTNLSGGLKTPVQSQPNPFANILSKVEITPESILSVLSKSQTPSTSSLQGLSSLIQSVAISSGSITHTTTTAPSNATVPSVKDRSTPSVAPPSIPKNTGYSPSSNSPSLPIAKASVGHGSSLKQPVNPLVYSSQPSVSTESTACPPSQTSKTRDENEPSSLEMKIHNFLKGNPGFSGLDLNIPILSGLGSTTLPEPSPDFHRAPPNTSLENVDGTPVRDERSGTPTQDEMMDKPVSSSVDTVSLLSKIISPDSSTPSSSRSPLLSKESEFQKLASLPAYRSFSLGGNSPNAYLQSSDTLESTQPIDSPLDKFFSESAFHEDEDYRDFEYSGPPPVAASGLEKMPSNPILKSTGLLEPTDYKQGPPNFGPPQDFARQSFPQSMQPPFKSAESSGRVSPSSELYGSYNLRGGNLEADRSPSLQKDEPFFPPDSHSLTGLHSGLSTSHYLDSPHTLQNRPPNFASKNNLSSRPPMSNMEQPGSAVSASTTMEFKTMLKNASRRPSDESQFSQSSLNEDIHMSGLSHSGLSSDERPRQEEHYRIETRVSSSSLDLGDNVEEKGAPIETLGYHNAGNMSISGEPIKIVESVRVGVKGNRAHGIDGNRGGWFEMGSSGSSFDDCPSSADEQASLSGSGVFKPQFEEHVPRFPDTVGDFRAKNMPPFDHHVPPPSMVPPLERGGPFQIEHAGPPSVPPPGLPGDHGSLFGRDITVTARMSSMEPPNPLTHGPPQPPPPIEHGMNPFPGHPLPEHGTIPFSPPPRLDMRHPFSQDHGTLHQGAIKEHYGMHTGSTRDHGPPRDHNGPPHARLNETMAPNSRDHHGPHSGPPRHPFTHHRDDMNPGGVRHHRPPFRPREPYHSLKRPRPPFGRGPQFFSPKRPFYPPRY